MHKGMEELTFSVGYNGWRHGLDPYAYQWLTYTYTPKRSKMLKYDYSYMQKNRCTEKQENEPKDKKRMSTEYVDESSLKFRIITERLL